MTQEEIDKVKQEAQKQGIDLTQIAILYGGTQGAPSQMGLFPLMEHRLVLPDFPYPQMKSLDSST